VFADSSGFEKKIIIKANMDRILCRDKQISLLTRVWGEVRLNNLYLRDVHKKVLSVV